VIGVNLNFFLNFEVICFLLFFLHENNLIRCFLSLSIIFFINFISTKFKSSKYLGSRNNSILSLFTFLIPNHLTYSILYLPIKKTIFFILHSNKQNAILNCSASSYFLTTINLIKHFLNFGII
jgi:hypothetical protein